VKPFELTEDETSTMLEGRAGNLEADMDILSECLQAAYDLGSARGHSPEILDDEIVIRGNAK
jgi:hypothetical protein